MAGEQKNPAPRCARGPVRAPNPDRRGPGAVGAGRPRSAVADRCGRLRVALRRRSAGTGGHGQQGRSSPAPGHPAAARDLARQHLALRARLLGQQRPALGRARYGQVLFGQGSSCGREFRGIWGRLRNLGLGGNSPRGHSLPTPFAGPAARLVSEFHPLLRRSQLRWRGCQL